MILIIQVGHDAALYGISQWIAVFWFFFSSHGVSPYEGKRRYDSLTMPYEFHKFQVGVTITKVYIKFKVARLKVWGLIYNNFYFHNNWVDKFFCDFHLGILLTSILFIYQ